MPRTSPGIRRSRRTPSSSRPSRTWSTRPRSLYGIPDVDPAALKRTADANPGLRWVQTMAAGGGGQVKAAGLSEEQLRRIVFTTSAGVHGGPLAEFAVFGLFAGAKDLARLLAQQRDRNWSGRWEMRQVSEMTVLVVGLGGIGQEVVKKVSGLGATVIGTSRHGKPVEHVDRLIKVDDIAATVPEVDAIVLDAARDGRDREADRRRGARGGQAGDDPGQRRSGHRGRRGRTAARAPRRSDRVRGARRVRHRTAAGRAVHSGPSRTSWSARTPAPSTRPRTG